MRSFRHAISGAIYLSMEDQLVWQKGLPDQTPTSMPVLHLYCRFTPDQGRPEREWGIEPIPTDLFEKVMEEIAFAEAYHLDAPLVSLIGRFKAYPCLPDVLRAVPRGSFLHVIDYICTREAMLFDIYQASEAGDRNRISLNPLLEPLLPWVERDGVRHFSVPYRDNLKTASLLLVLALERCLFGVSSDPAFSFSYGQDLEEYDRRRSKER